MRSLILILAVLGVACVTAYPAVFQRHAIRQLPFSGCSVLRSRSGAERLRQRRAVAFSPGYHYIAATRASEKYHAWTVYSSDTGQVSDQDFVETYYDPEGLAFYGDGDRLVTRMIAAACRLGRGRRDHRVARGRRIG